MKKLVGRGLHGGRSCTVTIVEAPGPTTLGCGDDRAPIGGLRVEGRDRCSVVVLPSGRELAMVEHLLSAIAGAGAFGGARIDVEGDELPLLDGAARAWFDALHPIARRVPRTSSPIAVRRAEIIEAFGTTISFAPPLGEGAGHAVEIAVTIAYDAHRFGVPLAGRASWDGTPESYARDVASARTFGAARELEALRARGLAAHLPRGSVVALDVDEPGWGPTDDAEPIRHKLLDAIGDLAALGAPLIGRVHLDRPSHRGTRAALERARTAGVLV